jgi:uncharacterized protein involved in exopolysaccharide biosynthesis
MDYWIIISISCIIGAALGFSITFLMVTKYESKVVVAYRNQDDKSGISGGLSMAAAQFGFGGLGADQSKRSQALETLQSKRFILSFIRDQKIKKDLFPQLWDADHATWKGEIPTDNVAYSVFSRKILSVTDDIGRNITEIKILARAPQDAADWANAFVKMANNELRQEAIQEAQNAVNFLNGQLALSNISEVRQTLAQLLQSNIETAMLANIHPDFAFKIIDPAVPSDMNSPASPNRIIFGAIGFLMGAIFAILTLLLLSSVRVARARRVTGTL